MIKAIIFDIGDVVTKVDESKLPHKTLKINGRVIPYHISRKLGCGKINLNKVYSIVARIHNRKYNEIVNAYNKWIGARTFMKGMPELLNKLEKSYVLATITNTTKFGARLHRKKGHYKWFSHRIISCDVGYEKPGKKIFMLAFRKLKFKPNECVFVDDRKENIITAKKLGMKAISFKSTKQLVKELRKQGIKT